MDSLTIDRDTLNLSPQGDPPVVAKLNNVVLREQVYGELANALRAGRFAPGMMVTIRGLAEMLGTSTMPVREAVSRLVSERALEMLPNRTLRVPTLSLPSLDELIDARVAVEGRAAWLAAERMTSADFSLMKSANEAYGHALDAGDISGAVLANEQLHFAIYRAARSGLLLSIIEKLWLQTGPYLASAATAQSLHEKGVMHHFDMLAALARRDPAAASSAVQGDILDAAEGYKQHLIVADATKAEPAPAKARKRKQS